MAEFTPTLFERIYLVVMQIAPGQVSTYGDVATVVGGGCDARTVGQALGALGERAADVPWQRVVNRSGGISTRGLLQRQLLEAEGVGFDDAGNVVLAAQRWAGPTLEWAAEHGFAVLPPRAGAEQLPLF